MTLIKDLVHLGTQLHQSVTDRKTRELLLPLQEKTLAVQQEQLRIEQRHIETVASLNQEHADAKGKLEHRIAALESENAELKAKIQQLEMSDGNTTLDASKTRILRQLHPDRGTSITQLGKQCALSEKQCLYHLLSLRNDNFVYSDNYADDPDWDTGHTAYESTWVIRQNGLEYLSNNGLLS